MRTIPRQDSSQMHTAQVTAGLGLGNLTFGYSCGQSMCLLWHEPGACWFSK
jgi:hypothetical protein